jgi:hypothetical protein
MPGHPIEDRFEAQQVITMAHRLPVREIEALGEATDLREAGLRAARSGDLARGRHLIADARASRESVALSEEASTLFETYQLAAQSYINYRECNYDAAISAMRDALRSANRLRAVFGYIVEVRRIHLAANLLRLAASSGSHDEAIRTGLRLVRYVLGDRNAWPWASLTLDSVDILSSDSKVFVLAQILRPLSDALATTCHEERGAALRDEALERLVAMSRNDAVGKAFEQWIAGVLVTPAP